MTEYITKERALQIAKTAVYLSSPDEAIKKHANNFLKAHLRAEPAANVAPVVHATTTDAGWDEIYCEWKTCNHCQSDNVSTAIYCNWCGARMDGGADQ